MRLKPFYPQCYWNISSWYLRNNWGIRNNLEIRLKGTTTNSQDHVITWDRTLQKYVDLVNNVMDRIIIKDLKQSKLKCVLGAKSITLFRHRLSKEEI